MKASSRRSLANLKVVEEWVAKNDWIAFLAEAPEIRSNTSVCLSVVSDKVKALPKEEQAKFLKGIASELGKRKVAYDIELLQGCPAGIPLLVRPHDRPRGRPQPPWRSWRRFTGKRSPRYRLSEGGETHEESSDQRQPVRGRDRDIQEDAGDRGGRHDEDDPR